jgi:hypothetical protein
MGCTTNASKIEKEIPFPRDPLREIGTRKSHETLVGIVSYCSSGNEVCSAGYRAIRSRACNRTADHSPAPATKKIDEKGWLRFVPNVLSDQKQI